MNNFRNQPPQLPKGIQLNVNDYPSAACKDCGSFLWERFSLIKRIPGTLVGAPQEVLIEVITLRCAVCYAMSNLICSAQPIQAGLRIGDKESDSSQKD